MATEVEFPATMAFRALAESSSAPSKPTLRHSDSTPVLASDSLLTLSFNQCILQRAGTSAEFDDSYSSEGEDCEYMPEEDTIPSPPMAAFTQSSSFESVSPSEVSTPHAPNCSLVGDAAGQHRGPTPFARAAFCVHDDCVHSVHSSTSFISEHTYCSPLAPHGVPTENTCAALPVTPQRASRVAGVRSKSSEPAAQRTQQISPSGSADSVAFPNGACHPSYFYPSSPSSSHSFNAFCHPAYPHPQQAHAAQQPSSSIQSDVLPRAYPAHQSYVNARNDHHRQQIHPQHLPSNITCACFVDHPFLVRPRDVRRGGRGCGRPRSPSPLRVVVTEPAVVEIVHNPYSFDPYTVVSHQLHNLNPLPSSMSLTPSIGSVNSPLEYPSDSVSTAISSESLNTAPDSEHSGVSSVYPGSDIVISPTDPRDGHNRYHRRVPSFSSSPSMDGFYLSPTGRAQVPAHSVTPMQYNYTYDQHQYYSLPHPYPAMMGQYLNVQNEFNGEMRSRSVESGEIECSDDGRSVVSSVVSTMRASNVSAVGTEEQVSVVGTEGVKKKRFRARCPTCTTTADVKRLRFKRGFTYFVCTRCHFKWRVPGAR